MPEISDPNPPNTALAEPELNREAAPPEATCFANPPQSIPVPVLETSDFRSEGVPKFMGDDGVNPCNKFSRFTPEADPPPNFERLDLKVVVVFLLLISCSFDLIHALDLFLPFVLKNRKRLYRSGIHQVHIGVSESLPNLKLLDKNQAVCRNQRFGALRRCNASPRPDRFRRRRLISERAMPRPHQTAFSALVAVPCGLVGKLELECDSQFFRSSSFRPQRRLTSVAISATNFSGPASSRWLGVAGLPSM